MSKLTRVGIGCVLVLAFSLVGTSGLSVIAREAHAAPMGASPDGQIVAKSSAPKGAPKAPKTENPPAAFDCTSPQLKSIYPSGGPPGKKGKAVKSYLSVVRKYIPVYEAKLHRKLGIAVCVNYPKQYSQPGSDDDASTGVYDPLGETVGPTISSCWIEINPANFPRAQSKVNNVLAHELFHCFQGVIGGLSAYVSPPYHDWVDEGQAEWAAATVAGPDPDDSGWWDDYLLNPNVALSDIPKSEGYREIGFYSHLQESGISPWDVIPAMLQASNDNAAFHAAVYGAGSGAAETFLDSWASGFFRDPARGHAWDTSGPGIPARTGPTPQGLRIGPGDSETREAKPYTEGLYLLIPSADIVTLQGQGHVRLADGTTDTVLNGSITFCTKAGGCECPSGETYDGPDLTALDGSNLDLALTGGETGSSVTAAGESFEDDYCTRRDPCLVGTWTVTDESAFVSTGSSGVFTLTGMSGSEVMTLDKKGKATVTADNFTIDLADPTTGGSGTVGISDGTTTAKWNTPADSDLEFTDVDIGNFVATLDGDPLPGGFFGGGNAASMKYTCNGNTLDLYPIPSDPSIAPIVLNRQ